MNRTNRIRIFLVTTCMSACLSFSLGYQIMKEWKDRQEQFVARETEQSVTEEETELSISNIHAAYEYMVVEEEGYLLVYMKDLKTVYMYTDIQLLELPDELQEEIRIGKPFQDLEELYAFLENYSS